MNEKFRGPEHPTVGENLWGLANIQKARGSYAEAESMFKRALAIFDRALGPQYPRSGVLLADYADLLRKMKRDDEAAKLEARAAEIHAKTAPKTQH
ncbi:MAG: tetratricopeptide repeat protein [Blastocatellia bacterium]|nr:tetratricopeptide repeat protein [Blastocatellia bacterium]